MYFEYVFSLHYVLHLPHYFLGEIAILVPTFNLSYLSTNLHNYGTFIYPIMVIRAPLLQSWYICPYQNSNRTLICNYSTFKLLLWYFQQKTTNLCFVFSIMVLTIYYFSTFCTETTQHNKNVSASPLALFCMMKAPLTLHEQHAAPKTHNNQPKLFLSCPFLPFFPEILCPVPLIMSSLSSILFNGMLEYIVKNQSKPQINDM